MIARIFKLAIDRIILRSKKAIHIGINFRQINIDNCIYNPVVIFTTIVFYSPFFYNRIPITFVTKKILATT